MLSWAEEQDDSQTNYVLWISGDSESTVDFIGHTASVNGALELSDGRILSWSNDGTIRLWNIEGKLLYTFSGHVKGVNTVIQLMNGNLLSWGQDKTLRLWTLEGATSVLFSSYLISNALQLKSGRILWWLNGQTGNNPNLYLWDIKENLLKTINLNAENIHCIIELENKDIVLSSNEKSIIILKYDNSQLEVLHDPKSPLQCFVKLETGNAISWSNDNLLKMWNENGVPPDLIDACDQVKTAQKVTGSLSLKHGRFVSWSNDNTLQLWNSNGVLIATLTEHKGLINGVMELTNGTILSWSEDATLRMWSTDGKLLATLRGHSGGIEGALELRDGRLLSWAGTDKLLRIWSTDGKLLTTLKHTERVSGVSDEEESRESGVSGAQELGDGRILSWSVDFFRLWSSTGDSLGKIDGDETQLLEQRDNPVSSLWHTSGETLIYRNPNREMLAVFTHDSQIFDYSDNALGTHYLIADGSERVVIVEYVAG
jgi:WD40 repeat protein